ncbi:MAG: hypothetical protein AAF585_18520 [Verrucomicrobiota bacterium]
MRNKIAVIGIVALFIVAALLERILDGDTPESANDSTDTPPPAPAAAEAPTEVNGFERLSAVRMIDHRNNDGDSFFVKHGDREFELRLYFADCAEKYYSDKHEDQRERVRDQAKDFGGLSVEETVLLGQTAKKRVTALLGNRSFTVYTNWERVFGGERFHGFVEIDDPNESGESIYLTELLIREGLARIHTKGEKTPDGRSQRAFRDHLESVSKLN